MDAVLVALADAEHKGPFRQDAVDPPVVDAFLNAISGFQGGPEARNIVGQAGVVFGIAVFVQKVCQPVEFVIDEHCFDKGPDKGPVGFGR